MLNETLRNGISKYTFYGQIRHFMFHSQFLIFFTHVFLYCSVLRDIGAFRNIIYRISSGTSLIIEQKKDILGSSPRFGFHFWILCWHWDFRRIWAFISFFQINRTQNYIYSDITCKHNTFRIGILSHDRKRLTWIACVRFPMTMLMYCSGGNNSCVLGFPK